MKLLVTIPAYNEAATIGDVIREIPRMIPHIDRVEVLVYDDGSSDGTSDVARASGADDVLRHPKNKGLAVTFRDLLNEALRRGADIIVNTDADNHYDQSKIPELIAPILEQQAELVIGSRKVEELSTMPFWNRILNRIGSFITTRMAKLPPVDVSTGFRAYSREAAMRIHVFSNHTYTHTTLISAADQRIAIVEVPIKARKVVRKSRLIPNIPHFLWNAGSIILRNIILFKPLRFFGLMGGGIAFVGLIGVARFLFFYWTEGGQGHVQSLVLSAVLIIVGFQVGLMGLVASAIGWSRRLSEEAVYRLRKMEFDRPNEKQITSDTR
ncbi:MAG: glycosyltransferase family 2 protein [Candidatus Kerfeldbacteria bacterium]|nr:glycosyltransferase family 2 protein [Candidatus Kerfeldbacteria bacterium]